jgi:two-component system OmpR family sensor kinase
MRKALVPLVAGLLGLTGTLGATLYLHRAANAALDRVLEERILGAGETAAEMVGRSVPSTSTLRAVMDANQLEGMFLLSPDLVVLADATGTPGRRADLLRVDRARVVRALAGEQSLAFSYAVGNVKVATGYFPVRGPGGEVRSVLALEGGQSLVGARSGLQRALWGGVALSAVVALVLAFVAFRWARGEEHRRHAAELTAKGEAVSRMAAMVAHEIRNPLGTIRGATELVRARCGDKLSPPDEEALADILGEVERLRRMTDDFLDLAGNRPFAATLVEAAEVAQDAGRALTLAYPEVLVEVALPMLTLAADPGRLRQVFTNLFANAAQAGAARIHVGGQATGGVVEIDVRDDGPGIDPALRNRLFDPFATGRKDGTGLGLAICRKIVEAHGGHLDVLAGEGPGTTFRMRMPLAGR